MEEMVEWCRSNGKAYIVVLDSSKALDNFLHNAVLKQSDACDPCGTSLNAQSRIFGCDSTESEHWQFTAASRTKSLDSCRSCLGFFENRSEYRESGLCLRCCGYIGVRVARDPNHG